MIAIETQDGELVKVISEGFSGKFGFHSLFGFIGQNKADERISLRRRQGFDFSENSWHCQFGFSQKNGSISFDEMKGCSVEKIDSKKWKLTTGIGDFLLRISRLQFLVILQLSHNLKHRLVIGL